jgi:hypothetical protein
MKWILLSLICFSFLLGHLTYPQDGRSELSSENSNKYIPVLSIDLPVPFTVGVDYVVNPSYSMFFNAGYAPIPILFKGGYAGGRIEALGRWHPNQGTFFLGGGLGYQILRYNAQLNLGALSTTDGPVPATVGINSFYGTFVLGWFWKVSQSLYLGADLGVTVPLFASGGLNVQSSEPASASLQAASQDAFGYFADFVLPRVGLRIGMEF